ncbi:hypothetical protein PPEP_b0565 [Pseudoalteromonas peptidolytica F12-50-A1]|uniref:Uncharacterized protein n=1 Tax=Pseudoalteromonas peptidolytica F12-50-A1 TaxID=1315280 RepID=A0A8I0MZH5_9GAMM|nr:hypothetical protein [Pseudoalteromonas peptidolytica F12-50-A1]
MAVAGLSTRFSRLKIDLLIKKIGITDKLDDFNTELAPHGFDLISVLE